MNATPPMPFTDPRHSPVCGLETIGWVLGRNSDEVLAFIEAGPASDFKLAWAWNIAAPGAERREIRVLSASVLEFIAAHGEMVNYRIDGWDGFHARRATEAQVWARMLPPGHSKPFLSTPEVQRVLGCSSELVLDLVRGNALGVFRKTEFGRGRYGAALVNKASLKEFLFERGRRIA